MKIEVNLHASPWSYAGPAGANMPPIGYGYIGTVTRDGCDTGALAVSAAGHYVQVNGGAVRSLPQAETRAAYQTVRHVK